MFPNVFKKAKVVLVFKVESRILCSNYKPITLLSNIGKIIEKLIHKRLNVFLEKKQICCNFQFGFRSNFSTNNALLSIVESIQSHLEKNNFCARVFVDLKKAFDTIDHHINLNIMVSEGSLWMVFILSEEQSTICLNWQRFFNHYRIANGCSPRLSARSSSLFTFHKWPSYQCQVCQNLSF